MTKIARILRNPWIIAGGLLAITAITYGLLIKSMGLYWDDWPSLWFLKFFGPGIFPEAFASDRPLQGWLFVLTTSIFRQSLFAWQVFGIVARWLSGLALGWLLISLWPGRKLQVLAVVSLFLVYPGFSQQFIPITYGHQFLIMSVFFVSLGLMIWSIRKPGLYWQLTAASLVLGVLSMFALEYYFGLELLRPVMLWILLIESYPEFRKRLVETIKRWLPYLIADILFVVWRMTHFTPRGEVTLFLNLAANPGATIVKLLKTIGGDIFESALLAWTKAFAYLNFSGLKSSVLMVYVAAVIAVALIALVLLLAWNSKSEDEKKEKRRISWGLEALLVGVYALLIGGWSFWVTDLRLELSLPWDRFTQPMMVGACLALVGLIDLITRPSFPRLLLIAALTGVAAGSQFHNAMAYRQDWTDQRNFFWQMAWRAPEIKPGTLLLTSDMPFFSSTDNSLTSAFNWIYAPDLKSREMPYLLYDINARLGNRLPSLDLDTPIKQDYRATNFEGNTSQALVFYFDPPRCMKALDLVTDRHYPHKPIEVVNALPLSKLDLISEGGEKDPRMPAFLGPEPKHGWCYYFEKVDLAVQLGKWEEAAKLADKGLKTKDNFTSSNAEELIPFIYAYGMSGQYDRAAELSYTANTLSKKMYYYLCDTWYYMNNELQGTPGFDVRFKEIFEKFGCRAP